MNKINLLTITFFLLIFSLSTLSSIAGRYENENYTKNIINHSLTLDKIYKWEYEVKKHNSKEALEKIKYYSGQTIFWKGYVSNYKKKDGYSITLKIDEKEVSVYFSKKTLNLDVNRKGCKVWVKGKVIFKEKVFSHIAGKSIILLLPPQGEEYKTFKFKNNLGNTALINTKKGPVIIKDDRYPFIVFWLIFHNPQYNIDFAKSIGKTIVYYSQIYKIDPLLMLSLFTIESALDYNAISSAGAIGFGQLMPGTAAGLGVDPTDPYQNIGGSIKLFSRLLDEWKGYDNSLDLALASYNAGPGAVSDYGGIPPFSETQNYVFFIENLYEHIKKINK